MSKYYLPEGMRYSTLEERKQFYLEEFNLEKVAEWFKDRLDRTKFAVIIGRHTKIYPEAYRNDAKTTIIMDKYRDLEDLRQQIIEFQPESVYYDRNLYGENERVVSQELAFDLDPENITCPVHGTLADKMKQGQGLGFCQVELKLVKEQTIKLYEYLGKKFSKLKVVYSGRGFHIHVFDEDTYTMSPDIRSKLATEVKSEGFAIDSWVTEGEMRLIRLPYSLHGMVSRLVLPLKKEEIAEFDPVHDVRCFPAFLQESVNPS
jgi:DNA primase catalytic subunit